MIKGTSKTDADNWERVAPDYINFSKKERKSYLQHLIYESLYSSLLELCGNVSNKHVLDAGCGDGRLSRMLFNRGAVVDGIDVSETMIHEARKINVKEGTNINYLTRDLTKPFDLGKTYDLIIANLVLFNIRDLSSTIKHISRATKPGGCFVFSIIHPCFNSNKYQRFNLRYIKRNGGKITFEIKKSYKDSHYYKADYRFTKELINFYHRPLEEYSTCLISNDFLIGGLLEPVLKINEIYDEKTYHQHYLPKFLVIRSVKKS